MEMQENQVATSAAAAPQEWKLPLTLTMVSLLIWFGFQTVQLVIERNSLVAVTANLHEAMEESQKVRAQLEAFLSKTAELARQGNPSARQAVAELQQKGIPISADPQPAR